MPAPADARQRSLFPERWDEEDAAVLTRLRAIAAHLTEQFRLRPSTVDAEDDGIVAHYGICTADGRIRIRLRHATTGRLLKESSLVDTLCHELAHLRYFDHSLRFRRFHERILAEARRRGWYRPGPRRTEPCAASFGRSAP